MAISELKKMYENKVLKDQANYHSIKWLKKNKIIVIVQIVFLQDH